MGISLSVALLGGVIFMGGADLALEDHAAPKVWAIADGEVSDPVSTAPAVGVKVDEQPERRCAAIAVSDGMAEGNGLGPTLDAAKEDALRDCKSSDGTNCRITSAECDPNEQ